MSPFSPQRIAWGAVEIGGKGRTNKFQGMIGWFQEGVPAKSLITCFCKISVISQKKTKTGVLKTQNALFTFIGQNRQGKQIVKRVFGFLQAFHSELAATWFAKPLIPPIVSKMSNKTVSAITKAQL
ncbi:hypothetical protein BB560_001924 [Smittium megazygosporum]|uniref:Uncharacterized protein n=1 Tax=Smittium megazygosporum TaxID=133381 RepID=A0A2T9ZGA9_9FUNG|nr:hypothetical protein BB560_001924 [Smittium megazygosporum]